MRFSASALPLLVMTSIAFAVACGRPPMPAAEPSQAKAQPAQEEVSVDFDEVLRPKPISTVAMSKPLSRICRVLVARAGASASGAHQEDEEVRVLRRAIMGRQRDVIAGEVAARVTAEVVGENSGQETVSRYQALSAPERLVLLAEKTGAQALLVLDQAGVWNAPAFLDVRDDGTTTVRDKQQGESATGCTKPPGASFDINVQYVGIRAKLVSLKKDDASILADIELMEPLSAPIGKKTFAKWSFAPKTRDYCPSHKWDHATDSWKCATSTETIGWTQEPKWCPELEGALRETQSQIKNVRYAPKFATMAEDLALKLFAAPVTPGACDPPAAAPVPVLEPKPEPAKKPASKK